MKNRKGFISIFVLLISMLACCFVFADNKLSSTYAVDATSQECFYLLGQDGNPYMANVSVGTIDGTGKYVVGTNNIPFTATANSNYQIKGWQITYVEQDNKVEYIDITSIDTQQEIKLTAKDGTEIAAVISVNLTNNFITSSTFNLSYIFEDLIVTPVFDHIYYFVEMTELLQISNLENNIPIGEDVLFYETKTTSGDVTTYSNSYVKIGDSYFFYGDLSEKNGKFYKVHQTLNDEATEEEIEYSLGAFRAGDEISIEYDVTIDSEKIELSKNIDFLSASIVGDNTTSLTQNTTNEMVENSYKIVQDEFLRTTQYELNFGVVTSKNQKNIVDIAYHDLYIVDLKILVDGTDNHNETSDVFGETQVNSNEILSNISIYNFFSRTNENNLQFLVKKSQDNNAKAFGVACATTIGKTIDGVNYRYYDFSKLDSETSSSKYYSSISQNLEIVIEYTSTQYEVNFICAEYIKDKDGNVSLNTFLGNVLDKIYAKRNDTIELTTESVEEIKNVGYNFVGFANSLTGEVQDSYSYVFDKEKPQSITVYLCFEKIEYSIIFTNYNQVKISDSTPLNSISFTISNGTTVTTETFENADLIGESLSIKTTLKINGTLAISKVINAGFDILGFSLKAPEDVTADDYFENFVLDEDFISENNLGNEIVIYVYEDLIKYTLTYYIEPTTDDSLAEDVIMASIKAECSTATIKRYDISNNEIDANNTTAIVAKIVISDLLLNDEVKLSSTGFSVGTGDDAYSYVFNWFTVDDKSTLSYEQVDNTYTHVEVINRSREIKVVYSMPSVKIMISVAEEFSSNTNFTFDYSVSKDGEALLPIEDPNPNDDVSIDNIYSVGIGEEITIAISNIAFGYNFIGYTYIEGNAPERFSELTFPYTAKNGINTVQLDFERIEYHFIFNQYGAGLDGEKVNFEDETYAVLDIDHSTVTFAKPVIGYYVSKVTFAENFTDYSQALSETNDYRKNADIINYVFALDREQFVNLVENYSTVNGQNKTEVEVRIDYSIFTYRVEVDYGITNSKGSSDLYVVYPAIELTYDYEDETYVALLDPTADINTIIFFNIPYNAKATMKLVGNATTGLSLAGWYYLDGTVVSQNEYKHSLEYLTVESVVEDKTFVYNLTYNAYDVNVVYISNQGNPMTYINNVLVSGNTKQITLFDKLDLEANASRVTGYVFDKITYKIPVYTEFNYTQETWETKFSTLYVLNNGVYQLNTSNEYNEGTTYYVYTEEIMECNTSIYSDESFNVADYALDADGKTISFVVEYKLLELTITNTIKQSSPGSGWTLTGRGKEGARVEFELTDLATFSISAKDQTENTRDIFEGDTVNFYDTVTINVLINDKAINKADNKEYDLRLGLTLSSVKIASKSVKFSSGNLGEYSVSFYVGEYFPQTSEEISITYTLYISAKTIEVTTLVQDSTTFYENIKMYINAYTYGFSGSVSNSVSGTSSLSKNFQFLSKANVYAELSTSYKENFVVSGAKVYCDGTLVLPEEYANYGINLTEDITVEAKLFNNLKVVFLIQPKLTYNNGPIFTKTFECDNTGVGIAQSLTVGSDASKDIQVADMLKDAISVKYISTQPNSVVTNDVTNVGRYDVIISFVNTDQLDWLNQIELAEDVALIIQARPIYLTYDVDSLVTVRKVYDGTSNYNIANIYKYLIIKDDSTLNLKYSDILSAGGNNLVLNSASCYISTAGKDAGVTAANESIYYNLYVYDYALKDIAFNNNFVLQNSDFVIYNFIQIAKREIQLQNVYIYNKVYDGTDKAELVTTQNITITNTISGDDIAISVAKLNPRFDDSSVGTNKKVLIDATNALVGKDVGNYYVKAIETQGLTIYPYSLTTTINGLGTVEIINKRGLTEKDKVDLIPLNATLNVSPIYVDTQQYVAIYGKISNNLKGNNEFAIGYSISFMVNGENVAVDNNLFLKIPSVKNLTGTYFLTGQKTGAIEYSTEDGKMLIDLSQISENVSHVYLTRTKILLKAWQIVLIIVGILLIIFMIVLILVIIRKRKHTRDSVHEKI